MSRFGRFLHRLFGRDHDHHGGGATGLQNGTIQTPAPNFGQVQFALAQQDAIEGVKGSTVVLYVGIQRTGGKDKAIGVSVQAIDGTAFKGIDYQLITSTVAFGDQVSNPQVIIVDILPHLASGNFTFQLQLINPTGGTTLGATSLMTITIKRSGFGEADFSGAAWGVQTPAGPTTTLNLTVQRNIAAKGGVGVSWHTTDGSAVAGTDYNAASGTLSWVDGDALFKTITVTILHRAPNPNRSFTVTIDTPTGGILIGAINIATVTISDMAPGANPTVTSSIPNQIVDDYVGTESEQLISEEESYFSGNILLFNSFESSILKTALNAITAVDANDVWVVGNLGLIEHTSNGGTSWATQTSGTTANLYGVSFVGLMNGWAVGAGGTILLTTNGGTTWTSVSSPTPNDLFSVFMVSSMVGWAVGAKGTILTTTNGGTTWTLQTSGTSLDLKSVSAITVNTAWTVGQNGMILTTANGGTTWTTQTSGTTNPLFGVSFASITTGWAVGANGTILNTVNGGTNWSAQTSGTLDSLNSVSFVSTTTGWAVGANGTILTTINGGTAWTAQTSNIIEGLVSVSAVSTTTAWTNSANSILKTTNSGTTWTTSTTIVSISGPGPAGTINGGGNDIINNGPSFSPLSVHRYQGHHN